MEKPDCALKTFAEIEIFRSRWSADFSFGKHSRRCIPVL